MPLFTQSRRHPETRRRAFTLTELLVAVSILLLLFLILIQVVGLVDGAWKQATADPYAEVENAFEDMASNLSSAALDSYQDDADATGSFRTSTTSSFTPDHLALRSDLAFACGLSSGTRGLLAASRRTVAGSAVFFVASRGQTQTLAQAGMDGLLNAIGYFVEFGDEDAAPSFLSANYHRWRWRLKQVLQPSEQLQIYSTTASASWINSLTAQGTLVPVLAENVIALAVLPERSANDSGAALAPAFAYDSRDTTNPLTLHQLPPRVHLALVAMDATSADHLAALNGSNAPAVVSSAYFQQAANLEQDLAALDTDLTARRIGHRIFEREIALRSSMWSNSP